MGLDDIRAGHARSQSTLDRHKGHTRARSLLSLSLSLSLSHPKINHFNARLGEYERFERFFDSRDSLRRFSRPVPPDSSR